MIDLTQYIPSNNSWMKEKPDFIGNIDLSEYYNKIFLRIYYMKPGEGMNIIDEVDPKNYKLFICCLCAVIHELESYGKMITLEDNATRIKKY